MRANRGYSKDPATPPASTSKMEEKTHDTEVVDLTGDSTGEEDTDSHELKLVDSGDEIEYDPVVAFGIGNRRLLEWETRDWFLHPIASDPLEASTSLKEPEEVTTEQKEELEKLGSLPVPSGTADTPAEKHPDQQSAITLLTTAPVASPTPADTTGSDAEPPVLEVKQEKQAEGESGKQPAHKRLRTVGEAEAASSQHKKPHGKQQQQKKQNWRGQQKRPVNPQWN